MTTKYEITYIIKPDVDDEAKKAIIDKYTKVIADNVVKWLKLRTGASVVSHTKSKSIVKVVTTS